MQQDEARKKQDMVDKLIKERELNLKEIKERDKMIGDKEQRIYDLKKQNQELEKFKSPRFLPYCLQTDPYA